MVRDLFFRIWQDEFGCGWLLFSVVMSLLCFALLFFVFARSKAKNEKLTKKFLFLLIPSLLIFYQIIPTSLFLFAFGRESKGQPQILELAIKTSMIPWQKGAYYCALATVYNLNQDGRNALVSYKKAFDYVKNYKYPCWGYAGAFNLYYYGKYDEAVEIAKNYEKTEMFIANCYLMKNDINNAKLYVDKAIAEKETCSNLAMKAYLLKLSGQKTESEKYYKKAVSLCKNEKQKRAVLTQYQNYIEHENSRLKKVRQDLGLI